MALKKKPHALIFYPVSEPVDINSVVLPTQEGDSVSITGQLTPISAQAAFERFGVDLARPHLWLCDVDDANIAAVTVGSRAVYGSREFRQRTPIQRWDAIPVMSYAECLLEEKEYL